jgi:hypothetical protein
MTMKYIVTLLAVLGLVSVASAADFQAQSLIKSGVTLSAVASANTNLPATVRNDAALWVNPDGSTANVTLVGSITGTNAAATNTVTFTLQTVPDGSTATTVAHNRFSFAMSSGGSGTATLSTNIPTALLQGCKAIRLTNVTVDSAAGGGTMTVSAKIAGFVP